MRSSTIAIHHYTTRSADYYHESVMRRKGRISKLTVAHDKVFNKGGA
jgi:hypothetical protein